eukprot:TRINITY_DN72284_c0_g1_i1.p1 TRINITY_DN72284_c0_g1~~TRINITY_DN72284_c0_g1_i1.p1  ORF type:complete len:109 (-),score=16.06 TRINITY_DN72284_c0_g1_i1:89-415(-)
MIDVILGAIFTPPGLYVLIGIVVLVAAIFLIKRNWESIEPYFFGLLDFLATIGRGILAAVNSCIACVKRTAYPIKECVLGHYDDIDHNLNPHKKKTPVAYSQVPGFRV